MKKNLLAAIALLFLTAVATLTSCSKDDGFKDPSDNKPQTLTVSIGDVQTKVAFEDQATTGVKLTWQENDELALYEGENLACVLKCTAVNATTGSGTFAVKPGVGKYNAATAYTVRYPAMGSGTTLTDYPATTAAYTAAKDAKMLTGQTQTGNTMDHLDQWCFMAGTKAADESTINLTHEMAIMTFAMDKPATADANEVPTRIVFDNGASKSYTLALGGTQAWGNAAYIIIAPEAGGTQRDLTFTVTSSAARTYARTVSTSKAYDRGKRYTAGLTDVNIVTRQPDVKVSNEAELRAAFSNARRDGDIIQVTADITYGTYITFNQAATTVTLDLNGKTVTSTDGTNGAITLEGSANLTITDYSPGGNGSITARDYTLRHTGSGTITLDKGTVEATFDNGYALRSSGSSNVVINGGTVKARSIAIYNRGTGNIDVNGGTVQGLTSGGRAIGVNVASGNTQGIVTISGGLVTSESDQGTIRISTRIGGGTLLQLSGGKVENTATTGNKYAVYNAAPGADNNVDVQWKGGIVTGDWYPTKPADPNEVASINTTYYTTLAAAFAAATHGQTITMLKDVEYTTAITFNKANTTVTLDLNGKTVTGPQYAISVNGSASLTVADGSTAKNGLLTAPNYTLWNINTGTVTVSGGTVRAAGNNVTIFNTGSGTIAVTGGTVEATGTNGTAIQHNTTGGTITVSSGTVRATAGNGKAITLNGRHADNTPVLLISGGTVESTAGYAILNIASGANNNVDVKWTAGEVEGNWYPTKPADPNEVASIGSTNYTTLAAAFDAAVNGDKITMLKDVEYTSYIDFDRSTATTVTLDLNGKTVTSTDVNGAIRLENSASLIVMGTGGGMITALGDALLNSGSGTITVNSGTVQATDTNGIAIYNLGNGAVNIAGGKVEATGYSGRAIQNFATGPITISGGEVTSAAIHTEVGTIRLYGRTGTGPVLTITGGTVSNTATSGNKYAVYNAAPGGSNVIDVQWTAGAGIVTGNWYPERGSLISVGNATDFKAAFSNTRANGDVIRLTANITLDAATVATFNQNGKSVVLDLNGKSITHAAKEAIILEGSANLTITDYSPAGTGSITATDYPVRHYGSGTITLDKGTVEATADNGYALGNYGSSNIVINGGTVKARSVAIYTEGTGNIDVNGGTVQGLTTNGRAIGVISNAGTQGIVTIRGGTVTSEANEATISIFTRKGGGTLLQLFGGTVSNTKAGGGNAVYNPGANSQALMNQDVYWRTGGTTVDGSWYPNYPPTQKL